MFKYPFYGWFKGRGKQTTVTGTNDSGVSCKLQDVHNQAELDLRKTHSGSTRVTITIRPSTVGGMKADDIIVFEGDWEQLKQAAHQLKALKGKRRCSNCRLVIIEEPEETKCDSCIEPYKF